MNEAWKDIPEYQGLYQASDERRIRSLPRQDTLGRQRKGKVLAPDVGYGKGECVGLYNKEGLRKKESTRGLAEKAFFEDIQSALSKLTAREKKLLAIHFRA